MANAITDADLIGWLKLPANQAAPDVAILQTIAAAVSAFVNDVAKDAPRAADDSWTETTRLGALMLGARLHRRRNSPNGVEMFTDQGASYVVRNDSDVSRLLRLGLPKVG